MQQIFLSLQRWIVALLDLIHPKSCLEFWQALRCGLMSFALLGEVIAGGGVLFGFSLWSRRWCLEWDFTEDTYSNQINSEVCDRPLGSDLFCHIRGNADFGPPSPLVNLQGKPETFPRMSQWKEMSCCASFQILRCLWVRLCWIFPCSLFASQFLC